MTIPRIFTFPIFLFLSLSCNSQSNFIVGIFDDNPITYEDISEYTKSGNNSRIAFNLAINDLILLKKANDMKITPDEKLVETNLKNIAERNNIEIDLLKKDPDFPIIFQKILDKLKIAIVTKLIIDSNNNLNVWLADEKKDRYINFFE